MLHFLNNILLSRKLSQLPMTTKNHFSWNILLVGLGCFFLTIYSSSGMFGEEFDKAKADEAVRLKSQQQAEQQQRQRELTGPDNQQVSESSTTGRGNLNNANGPAEIAPESFDQDKAIDIIIGSYFQNPSPQERSDIASAAYEQLASMERFLNGSGRILTPEDKICFITETVAKKVGVPPPKTDKEILAAYHQAVAQLGSRLGLEGRPTEEIVEISSRLREYELEAMMFDDPQLTEEGRINFAARIAAKIDARKAAATQLLTASAATVTHLSSSAPTKVAEPIQKVTFQAPAVSLSAPVKAAPTLPPQPPQESLFERQKEETLWKLQDQIDAARNELATHQETQQRFQQQLNAHAQNVKTAGEAIAKFERENPVRMITSIFKPSQRLGRLYDAKNFATRNKNEFFRQNIPALEDAKKSIATVSSRIKSLEGEHTRVAASEDPVIVEQRQQEAAVASAARFAKQREIEIEEGKIAGLAQRKAIEAQLAEERAKAFALQQRALALASTHHSPSEEANNSVSSSPPSTPPGSKGSGNSSPEQLLAKSLGRNSDGSTSGEESNHSTPEKNSLTTAVMTEVERLKAEVEKIHEAVVNARRAVKEAQEELNRKDLNIHMVHKIWQTWEPYFELAEERSRLKQRLSMLKDDAPEPVFKRSLKDILLDQYKDARSAKFPYFENLGLTTFLKDLQNIYEHHGIHNMEDYHKKPEVQEREQPLIQRLQEARQRVTIKLLQAELALLAPEEHPPILQQIEECVWQNMPGFSEKDREQAMKEVYTRHCLNVGYAKIAAKNGLPSVSTGSSDWWEREGKWVGIRQQQDSIRQQQTATWNSQQTSMMQSAMANGSYYQPNYRTW